MSNEYVPYLLIGGFSVIGILLHLMGVTKVIRYNVRFGLNKNKKMNSSETISIKEKQSKDLSKESQKEEEKKQIILTDIKELQTKSKSKGQHLYDSILNNMTESSITEQRQYVAEILQNITDEEFDEIMMSHENKMGVISE